jgi:hypothetical protein
MKEQEDFNQATNFNDTVPVSTIIYHEWSTLIMKKVAGK